MEFRQLEYFYTISKLENFTRTAETLHVSQPSVTKAIKALEAELNVTLIDRSQRHVALTPEGRAFLTHVEKILQDMEETKQDMQRFRRHVLGTIHFGIPPMIEAYLFPDFFTQFHEAHPQVELGIFEYNDSVDIRQKLEDGVLDFGIVLESPGTESESEVVLLISKMSFCAQPHHPLAQRGTPIAIAELRGEKFIMQQVNTYQYGIVYGLCAKEGFTPDILMCTTQLKTIKQLVVNGMGISILPDFVTRMETKMARLPMDSPLKVQVSLCWNPGKAMSEVDKMFVAFAKHYTETNDFKRKFRQK